MLVRGSENKVYWMENGQRRHIPDPETFNAMGLNWDAIQQISDGDLNDIPQSGSLPSRKNGALVRGSENKVYWMENGQRRHIPNPETFNAMGLNWAAIQNVSDADLNMIPLGSPLPPVLPINAGAGPITTYTEYLKRLYGDGKGVITQYPSGSHNAIDSVNQGSSPYKVYALAGGKVTYVGKDQYGGNYVQVWNPDLQRYFYYVHFASFNPSLKIGHDHQDTTSVTKAALVILQDGTLMFMLLCRMGKLKKTPGSLLAKYLSKT